MIPDSCTCQLLTWAASVVIYTVYHLPSTEWTIADVHGMTELITAGHMKRSTCVSSICIEYIVFVFVRI